MGELFPLTKKSFCEIQENEKQEFSYQQLVSPKVPLWRIYCS